MKRADLLAYLDRDWDAVARLKRQYRRHRRERYGAAEILRVMSELRDHMRAIRPDWPTRKQREEDLETHRRVAEALHRTPRPRR